ncbi:heme biosynthesis HemY N-terminal domain-containing protein [Rickettsiaceae bacterium]|nr:heme biosynthesis HemY N-terminal domain-containing protein [Rickettsiaceae bacterium]
MIRFLILIISLLLLYLGFDAIASYDFPLYISALNYQIETTLFVFAVIFLLTGFFLMLLLKAVFLIFNTPNMLMRKWKNQRVSKSNKALLNSLIQLVIGDRQKSLSLIKRVASSSDKENKSTTNIILAETIDSSDKKISYLTNLLDEKEYSFYASKKLAEISYKSKQYEQAKNYALRAFNENDSDIYLMLLLIRIYAALELWAKCFFVVSKLEQSDKVLFMKCSLEISEFYYLAAKTELKNENDSEALEHLEYALEIRPDYIEALSLFTEISTNMKNTHAVLKVLESAFLANPSFEIAEIYIASCTDSPEIIYKTLAKIVSPKEHEGLFLAISGYLNLTIKFP